MTAPAARTKRFAMIREFHLADWVTLGNAVCGTGALFAMLSYLQDGQAVHVYYACALVLAALSFLYCPVVFAVVALVLARQAETDIAESHGWVTGSGLVTGARVAAWINIGLSAVVLVGLAVVLAVAPGSR